MDAASGPRRTVPRIRGPIVRNVARAASRSFGISVSPRTAERCLEDYRALVARLSRELATKGERVEPYRRAGPYADLARKCARWAVDIIEVLRDAEPDMEGIANRARGRLIV